MKTAREVAHEIFAPTWEHTPKELTLYDGVVKAIEAARREGAEWMRDSVISLLGPGIDAEYIRALPLEPKP